MSNDTETATLSDFLLARIAEDEAVARAASAGSWEHDPSKEWHTDAAMLARARSGKLTYGGEEFVRGPEGACVAVTGPADDAQSMSDAAHIARHDPTRVLAECEAKRRVIASLAQLTRPGVPRYVSDAMGFCLAQMANPYADHPGYDEAWRP